MAILQQDGRAIYLRRVRDLRHKLPHFDFADEVRVKGWVEEGGFAPVIAVESMEKIRRAELPPPVTSKGSDLLRDELENVWVSTRARVVQGQAAIEGETAVVRFCLDADWARFTARIFHCRRRKP